jgi:hypothetical protein
MALRGTVCKICTRVIEANGLALAKAQARSHLMTEHKEEWQEFESVMQTLREAVKQSREAMLSKAEDLIHDPELIIPSELL